VSHHVTFLINSLAHLWGTRPYTEDNTARDNPIVALLTYGEGYHNFHHMFAEDYRNGVRAWQWDPSKWFIALMAQVGLASNLKRVPWFRIQRAILDAQFQRAERQLSCRVGQAHTEALKQRVAEEYSAFCQSVATWTRLREQWLQDAKRVVLDRWERSILQSRIKDLEHGLATQHRRMRVLGAQIAYPG
jgi:stearoyl-CoA desaturase (delta-9 desaturase)